MLHYILDQFSSIYDIDNVGELVDYGTSTGKKILIEKHCGDFFEGKEPHPKDLFTVDWKDRNVPVLFQSQESGVGNIPIQPLNHSNDSTTINVDIIASSFYFLSSWQEVHDNDPDEFGRFRHTSSLQYQHNFTHLPVVNYYFDMLKSAIEKVTGQEIKFRHWNDKVFALFLSHDLDKLYSGWKEGSWSEIKKGRIGSPPKLVAKRFFGKDAWFNIEEIMEIEKEHGFRSTFFFLPEKGRHLGVLNADYDISSSVIQKWITTVDGSGWEAGIHGAYGAAFEEGTLARQLKKFPLDVKTNRFHFLSWKSGVSEKIIEENGLQYDCSLGFAEEVGFRHGIAHPFQPYLIKEGRKAKFTEVPLHIMDSSLRDPRYKGEGPVDMEKLIEPVLREVQRFRGCLSVLWHNNYMSKYKYAGWDEAYVRLLKLLREEGAHCVTPKDTGGFWE